MFVAHIQKMGRHRITLVDDKKKNFNSFADFLGSDDFIVDAVSAESELLEKVRQKQTDLIILPVELQGNNGIDFCHSIKNSKEGKHIFIVLVSKRKEEVSLIQGLESGADDFLFHPIHERVLLSRLKAILKRKSWNVIEERSQSLVIDYDRYLIIAQGKEYYLPKKEFEILSLLNSKPNKVFSRDEIKNAVWENFEKVRGRTVDVHIRKIREKIGESLIATVKGVGYRLEI